MTYRPIVFATVLLFLTGCAARQPATIAAPALDLPPFVITFWCAPPWWEFTDARMAEVAAAGFNLVGPPCEGLGTPAQNQAALGIAARHGLRVVLVDRRYDRSVTATDGWESGVDAAMAEYRDQPGVGGYFVNDEPVVSAFRELAHLTARIQAGDPAHVAYVNLFPNYVLPEGLEADDYESYVDQFLTIVRPQVLSFDYYPFLTQHRDRPGFLRNLATIRAAAQRHHLPFWTIVQAMPHGHYRDPTEAELAWQVFHALAYGTRGISYFTYWTPVDVYKADEWEFRYGMIEGGSPTLHYYQAQRLNRVVAAMAAQLTDFDSIAIADSRGEVAPAFPIGPIDAIDGGPITAGLFANPAGDLAVLLVNRDYRYGTTATLRLHANAPKPEVFAADDATWAPAASLTFSLPPGEARLLRWRARRSQ